MRTLVVLSLVGLAGCPPPPRYLVTDVVTARAPVRDALVAVACGGPFAESAQRTNEDGRARLVVSGSVELARCTVTVAKPGFRTVELPAAHACTPPLACPASLVWLQPEVSMLEVEP